ncbi:MULTISPECIES: hypothetical protein [Bacillus]|uniref:hypothetical protein n=1 Tax=Bacillus TaxID=1386 RepID=UPI001C63E42F|nr:MULTISPECIES: hypothetical protein [Bacillus]MCX2809682.1 hypothetical protein [Bacillus sp. ChL18]QYJ63562.1 hypothetical protein J8615_10950 [Bacillus velezensis]GJI61641.1 hypothetical protein BVSY1_07970 [Bacillus velezensis]
MASKKLNLGLIEESVSKYDKKERVQLTDDVHVFIYPYFSPTRLTKMLTELITDQEEAKEAGIKFEDINPVHWGHFSLIKEFTDLGIPNDIKNKVKWFVKLIDSEYFPMIIKSFPEESIEKLEKAAKMMKMSLDKFSNMSKKEINELILNRVEEIENEQEAE